MVLNVVKSIAKVVLGYVLRVTGVADYAATTRAGEFFGKAKLPAQSLNHDDEVEPNPDLSANAAMYGPDINLGPFSFGTSLRFNWSLIKYIKNAPQYLKHGLNWLMKKSGLEDFAKGVVTPLKQQAINEAITEVAMAKSILEPLSKHLPPGTPLMLRDPITREKKEEILNRIVETYRLSINEEIKDVQLGVDSNINYYLRQYIKKNAYLSEALCIELAQKAQQKIITNLHDNLQKVLNENVLDAVAGAVLAENEKEHTITEAKKLIDKGCIAIGKIEMAVNALKHDITQNYESNFKNAFEREALMVSIVAAPGKPLKLPIESPSTTVLVTTSVARASSEVLQPEQETNILQRLGGTERVNDAIKVQGDLFSQRIRDSRINALKTINKFISEFKYTKNLTNRSKADCITIAENAQNESIRKYEDKFYEVYNANITAWVKSKLLNENGSADLYENLIAIGDAAKLRIEAAVCDLIIIIKDSPIVFRKTFEEQVARKREEPASAILNTQFSETPLLSLTPKWKKEQNSSNMMAFADDELRRGREEGREESRNSNQGRQLQVVASDRRGRPTHNNG